MGAPIIVPQRRNIWESLLPQMFLMKIKHNMDMDVLEAETKQEAVKLKEKRQYQEKTRLGTEKRGEATQIRKEGRAKPMLYSLDGKKFALTGGKLTRIQSKSQKVWSKKDQSYVFRTPEQIAQTPDAYGRTKKTVLEMRRAGAAKISIGEKQKQQNIAFLTSPKFMADVAAHVKKMSGTGLTGWKYKSDRQKRNEIRAEAERRVKSVFGDAVHGIKHGRQGWWIKDENGEDVMVSANPLPVKIEK